MLAALTLVRAKWGDAKRTGFTENLSEEVAQVLGGKGTTTVKVCMRA